MSESNYNVKINDERRTIRLKSSSPVVGCVRRDRRLDGATGPGVQRLWQKGSEGIDSSDEQNPAYYYLEFNGKVLDLLYSISAYNIPSSGAIVLRMRENYRTTQTVRIGVQYENSKFSVGMCEVSGS